jgi:hypothetical protein
MIRLTKTDANFPAVAFVTLAINPKHIHETYRLLYVPCDHHAVGTDGRRLHQAPLPDIDQFTPGLYEIIKRTRSEIILTKATTDAQYPDYKRLFPKGRQKHAVPALPSSTYFTDFAVAAVLRTLPAPNALHLPYLTDALSGAGDAFTVGPNEGDPVELFGTMGEYALIMPLKG